MDFIDLKPSLYKRLLLLSAGITWSMASFYLIAKGMRTLVVFSHHLEFHIMISFLSGALLYILLFKNITTYHSAQIYGLKKKLNFASWFNKLKTYFVIIFLFFVFDYMKKTFFFHQVDSSVITILFGVGLFLSSVHFFYLTVFFIKGYKKYYFTQNYVLI